MKPIKPYMGTIQVPNTIMAALCKRRLTNCEARVILAVCSLTDKTPGRCNATIAALAKELGTNTDICGDLVRRAVNKRLLKKEKSGLGPLTHSYQVTKPETWKLPG